MRTFRLFVSSPGDVAVERRRTETVVSRLNGEFAGLARLLAIRWETEHYLAHSTFQTQIPPAADCDIVVGILKWRLGTELPGAFEQKLPDGHPYPSGTAYEILSAIERRKSGAALPDVFVFRYASGSPNPELDDPQRDRIEREWAALRKFFERWFVTAQGQFVAALNDYASEDGFEQELERLLRKWLAEKVAGGSVVPWPASKGSPFRGLGVFGARHAPVFFGRAADIRRSVDLLADCAARGAAYLLLVGASGAGKSSLARAGLTPRITTPGVIAEVDRWRVSVMRPADSGDGPFMALATALLHGEHELPFEEEGRGAALPEIAEGDSKTPAELAAVLSGPKASAVRPIVNALARIGEGARRSETYHRELRCDLVLLVDQFEELFAPSVTPPVRAAFAELMAALVETGRVWLLATLRADLYAPMLDVPALKRLKDIGGSYDLAPPGAADLAEIVRGPADAAGLVFETDERTGERLDERLLREADRPDMLPLVQLVLSRLWEARQTVGAATVMPVAAFEKLGGVKGIIAEAAETALAGLGDAARAHLGPLIRSLAEVSDAEVGAQRTLTARAVPLADAAPDGEARKLVDALVSARLLTLIGSGGAPLVRLAHQRVLSDWARAATIVAESAEFYRIRDEVDDERLRWEASKRRSEFLLPRGLPLGEARKIATKYGAELSPQTHAYIAVSQRRANRAQMIGWAAAAMFALLAIAAGVAAKVAIERTVQADAARDAAAVQRKEAVAQRKAAVKQRREAETQRRQAEAETRIAERNFEAAKDTVDGLIFDIAQGLRDVAGMRVGTIRKILETAARTVDRLLAVAPDDRQLLRSRAAMLVAFSDTYRAAGALTEAVAALAEAVGILRRLAGQDAADAQALRDLSVALGKLGDIKQAAGDHSASIAAYDEDLAIARKLAARDPGDAQAARDLSVSLDRIGDVKLIAGDQAGALAAYEEVLAIALKPAAQNRADEQAQRDVAVALSKLGNAKLRMRDQAGALAAYKSGLAISRKLAAANPDDARAQRDVSIGLEKVGDMLLLSRDLAGALAVYMEDLVIARKLAAQDPGNAQARRDVSISLTKIGDVKLQQGDRPGALAAYDESLRLRRELAARDPHDAQAQRDAAIDLDKIGKVKLRTGDLAGALVAYEASLAIARKLAAADSSDGGAQRDLSVVLNAIGDVKKQSDDPAGALAAYRESLGIRRTSVARAPDDADVQWDLAVSLARIAEVFSDPVPFYREALAICEALDKAGRLAPARIFALEDLRKKLAAAESSKPR